MKINDDFYNYDLIVIGGGIGGCAVVRDASLRGIRSILIEKDDIGSGAGEKASGIIDGDISFDIKREFIETSAVENGYLQYSASHLLSRIPMLLPVYDIGEKYFFDKIETILGLYDKYAKYKNTKKYKKLSQKDTSCLYPGISDKTDGALAYDEWSVDVSRLALLNALDAYEHGAVISTHTEVKDIVFENGKVREVEVFDKLSRRLYKIKGRFVVNATGAWSDIFLKKFDIDFNVKKRKEINLVLERNISNYGLNIFAGRNKNFYMIPRLGKTVLGGKSGEYFGNPENITVNKEEISYILNNIERIVPDIKKHRIINAYSGIRPFGDNNEKGFLIVNHKDRADNLYTALSFNLTSFRLMAETLVDEINKKFKTQHESATVSPLPGAEGEVDIRELSYEYKLSFFTLNRLYKKYGKRIYIILNMIKNENFLKTTVCKCQSVTEAEIRYAVKYEFARTIDDIKRRTHATLGTCGGMRCRSRISEILKEELNLDILEVRKNLKTVLQKRFEVDRVILNAKYSLQQAEIDMADNILINNLDLFRY